MVVLAPPSTVWYEWTDILGQTYRPGDYVVYAGVSSQASVLHVGKVDRINRYKADGSPILTQGPWNNTTKTWDPGVPSATVRVIPLSKLPDGTWTDRKVKYNYTTRQNEPLEAPASPKTFQRIEHVIKVEWTP
jgi:hypothetical protein